MKAVSRTAYYCCGVRMQDAESANPLVGDEFARRLLGEEGLIYWEEFKRFKRPNAGNICRHYLIDQWVQKALQKDPQTPIFLIGAGLDSRAYRFPSGKWIDIDEPAIIAYKNERLPIAECPNVLQRISIDFGTEKLVDHLTPFSTTEPVVIIVEGVFMYLSHGQRKELRQTLQSLFPRHNLLCDLLTLRFFNQASKKIYKKIVKTGTSFQDLDNQPWRHFLNQGYQQKEVKSCVIEALERGLVKFPKFLLNGYTRKFMMGYSVYRFEWDDPLGGGNSSFT